jgi:hypothetical protein
MEFWVNPAGRVAAAAGAAGEASRAARRRTSSVGVIERCRRWGGLETGCRINYYSDPAGDTDDWGEKVAD